ncbi:MAG: flippase-like domain-containing protein [Acidimicrobiia bacterium]
MSTDRAETETKDHGLRATGWFFVPDEGGRARRTADVVWLLFGVLLVFVTAIGSDQTAWFTDFLAEVIALLPSWLDSVFSVVYVVGAIYAIVIVVAAIMARADHGDLLRDLLISVAFAVALVIGLAWIVSGSWPILVPEFGGAEGPFFPVARIALVTAVLVVAGPYLVLPLRRLSWFIILLLFVVAVALGYGFPVDALGGLGIGLVAANAVLLIFGSARGFPPRADVLTGMEELRVPLSDLEISDLQSWGVRRFDGTTSDGDAVIVRVYGRDASDAQLVSRWWRSIWYRDSGPSLTSSRLHQVEHEALMTINAARDGVPVQDVLAAGEPNERIAIITLSARGEPAMSMEPDDVSDTTLVGLWRSVAQLHAGGLAHGRLSPSAVRVSEGVAILQDFSAASSAAPDDRQKADIAELLATSSTVFGMERAVKAAREGLGDAALTEALPYVQRSALSTQARDEVSSKRSFFADLREEIAGQLGVEAPKPAQLTRLSWKSLLMFGLTLLAGYALIGMLAGIDFVAVWEELQNANWAWIVLGLIVATTTLWTDALSWMSAVTAPLPLRPTVQLESSIKFIQLAIGGAAGRMATNVTYLRKFGVNATDAVTQGGVDSLAGFIIQITILLLAILVGNVDLIPDDATVDINWLLVIGLVVFALVVSALVLRFVPAIRERVIPPAKQMWDGLRGLATDPSRLIGLFGFNLGSQLLFGLSLWLTAVAFGVVLPFLTMVVIYVAMALLGGLLPIPGGVGVSEAVLTAGLTAVGVDEATAFAIAVVFRVSSAYLPPVWGWFSLRWLQANDYL